MSTIARVTLFSLLVLSTVCFGARDKNNPPIKAGTEITVVSYQPEFDTFVVKINAEPAVGPNPAYSRDLWRALKHEGSHKDFLKNKERLLGSIFTLVKELPIVDLNKLAKKLDAVKKKTKK